MKSIKEKIERFQMSYDKQQIFALAKLNVKKFYCERIYDVVNQHKRSEFETYIQLTLRFLLLLVIYLKTDVIALIVRLDSNFTFLKESFIQDIHDLDIRLYINIISVSLNSVLLTYLAVQFVLSLLSQKQKMNTVSQGRIGEKNTFNGIVRIPTLRIQQNQVERVFSFIFKAYNQTLLLIFIHYATVQLDSLGVVALFLTIFLGYIANSLDYEYLINTDEFFCKKYDILALAVYLIECLVISLLNELERKIQIIILTLFTLIQICFYFTRSIFISNTYLEKYCQFLNLLIFLNFGIVSFLQYFDGKVYFLSFALLITVPASYKIAEILVEFNRKQLLQYCSSSEIMDLLLNNYLSRKSDDNNEDQDNYKLDGMLRNILFQKDVLHLKENLKQILKYNFSASWCSIRQQVREEQSLSDYFRNASQVSIQYSDKQKYQSKSLQSSRRQQTEKSDRSTILRKNSSIFRDNLSQIETGIQNNVLLYQIFLDAYNVILENKTEVCELHISMLVFILEVVKNYQLFWMKLNTFSKLDISFKQLQIFSTLERECDKQVRIQLKKSQTKSVYYSGYLDVIYFDNLLSETVIVSNEACQQKLIILDQMKKRNIDLGDLYDNISLFLSERSKILQNIKIASRINSASKELEQICIDYQQILSFSNHDLKNSKLSQNLEENNDIAQMLEDKYTNYFDDNTDKFSSDTCIVYVSLKREKQIEISQVSNNFLKIFNFKSREEVLNRSLDLIIPSIFSSYHAIFIKNYFDKPSESLNENSEQVDSDEKNTNKTNSISLNTCMQSQFAKNTQKRILFGVTSENHLVALKLDVKVNKISFNGEFGMTAQMQQINKYNDYILLRQDTCQVISMTKLIHQKIFKVYPHFRQIKLKKYFTFLRNQAEYMLQSNNEHFQNMFENEGDESDNKLEAEEQIKAMKKQLENHKKNYRTEFEYILVVKKYNKSKIKNQLLDDESPTLSNNMMFYNKYSFFKLSLALIDFPISHVGLANYQLSYIEITSIKRINPQNNQRAILEVITSANGKNKTNITGLSLKNLQILYADLEESIQKTILIENSSTQKQILKQITFIFSQTLTGPLNQFTSEQVDSSGYSQENNNHLKNNNNMNGSNSNNYQTSYQQNNQNFFSNTQINHRRASAAEFTENQDSFYFQQNTNNKSKNLTQLYHQKQEISNDSAFYKILKDNLNTSVKLDNNTHQNNSIVNHNNSNYVNSNNVSLNSNAIPSELQPQSINQLKMNMNQGKNNSNVKEQQIEQNIGELIQKASKQNLEDIVEEDNNNNQSIEAENKQYLQMGNKNDLKQQIISAEDEDLNEYEYSMSNMGQMRSSKFMKEQQNKHEQSYRSEVNQYFDVSQMHQDQLNQVNKQLSLQNSQLRAFEQTLISPKIYSDQNLVTIPDTVNGNNQNNYNNNISNLITNSNNMNFKKLQSLPYFNKMNSMNQMLQSKSTLKENNNSSTTDFTKKFPPKRYYSNNMDDNEKNQNEIREISDIDEDEEDVSKRKAYKIYSDLTTKKNNFTEDKKREILDTSSQHSKVSSIEQVKKQFRKTILTKKSHYSLFFVNIIGVISILVIFAVNFQQFFATKQVLGNVKEDFTIAQWPMNYNNQLYGMIEAFNQKRLTNYKDSNLEYSLDHKEKVLKLIQDKIDDCFDSLKQLLRDIMAYDINRTIVSIIFNEPFSLNLNSGIISSVARPEDILDCNLGYCMISMQNFIYRYSHIAIDSQDTQAGYSEVIFLVNQRPISTSLRSLFTKSIDYNKESLDDIKGSLNNLVIIITTISAVCISLVVPLYSFIQTYREKILSLLTTFSIDVIDEIVNQIDQYYFFSSNNTKNLSTTYKSSQKNEVKQKLASEIKKQNLSYFSKLPKFNKKLMLSSLAILLLIILYPILNRQFTYSYIEESKQNLSILCKYFIYSFHFLFLIPSQISHRIIKYFQKYLIVILSRVKSYILLNVGLQYFGLTVKQFPVEEKVLTLADILDRIETSLIDQTVIQEGLIDMMQGSYLKDRYEQSEFNNFFIGIMTGNPCEVIKQYPQFINKQDFIDDESCQRQYSSILKNGLLIALKSYMSNFKDVYLELRDGDPANLRKLNIFDYNEQTAVLANLLDNLSSFIQMKNQEYYDYIINCQIYLMIYQFFALTVVFYLSWVLFYKYIDNQLHYTKLSLSFLNISHLISNPYIQSYFQQKSKLIS